MSADGGCHWCKLLFSTRTKSMPQHTLQVTVGFRPSSSHAVATPKAVQTLRLMLNGTPHSVYYVATDPGMSMLYQLDWVHVYLYSLQMTLHPP